MLLMRSKIPVNAIEQNAIGQKVRCYEIYHTVEYFSGLPNLDYLLTPRYKATQLCIDRLHQVTDAIYDVTAAYSNTTDTTTGERLSAPGLAGTVVHVVM